MAPPFPSRRATCAAFALLATAAACAGDQAPTAPAIEPRTFTAAPDVLTAITDAAQRAVPALGDSTRRVAVSTSLAELTAALEGGQAARSRRALARLDALLGAPARAGDVHATREIADSVALTPPDADAADAAAVLVTTALVRQHLDSATKAP